MTNPLLGTPSITSDAFLNTALLAGNVQNTSFVPAEKSTALSELDEEITNEEIKLLFTKYNDLLDVDDFVIFMIDLSCEVD